MADKNKHKGGRITVAEYAINLVADNEQAKKDIEELINYANSYTRQDNTYSLNFNGDGIIKAVKAFERDAKKSFASLVLPEDFIKRLNDGKTSALELRDIFSKLSKNLNESFGVGATQKIEKEKSSLNELKKELISSFNAIEKLQLSEDDNVSIEKKIKLYKNLYISSQKYFEIAKGKGFFTKNSDIDERSIKGNLKFLGLEDSLIEKIKKDSEQTLIEFSNGFNKIINNNNNRANIDDFNINTVNLQKTLNNIRGLSINVDDVKLPNDLKLDVNGTIGNINTSSYSSGNTSIGKVVKEIADAIVINRKNSYNKQGEGGLFFNTRTGWIGNSHVTDGERYFGLKSMLDGEANGKANSYLHTHPNGSITASFSQKDISNLIGSELENAFVLTRKQIASLNISGISKDVMAKISENYNAIISEYKENAKKEFEAVSKTKVSNKNAYDNFRNDRDYYKIQTADLSRTVIGNLVKNNILKDGRKTRILNRNLDLEVSNVLKGLDSENGNGSFGERSKNAISEAINRKISEFIRKSVSDLKLPEKQSEDMKDKMVADVKGKVDTFVESYASNLKVGSENTLDEKVRQASVKALKQALTNSGINPDAVFKVSSLDEFVNSNSIQGGNVGDNLNANVLLKVMNSEIERIHNSIQNYFNDNPINVALDNINTNIPSINSEDRKTMDIAKIIMKELAEDSDDVFEDDDIKNSVDANKNKVSNVMKLLESQGIEISKDVLDNLVKQMASGVKSNVEEAVSELFNSLKKSDAANKIDLTKFNGFTSKNAVEIKSVPDVDSAKETGQKIVDGVQKEVNSKKVDVKTSNEKKNTPNSLSELNSKQLKSFEKIYDGFYAEADAISTLEGVKRGIKWEIENAGEGNASKNSTFMLAAYIDNFKSRISQVNDEKEDLELHLEKYFQEAFGSLKKLDNINELSSTINNFKNKKKGNKGSKTVSKKTDIKTTDEAIDYIFGGNDVEVKSKLDESSAKETGQEIKKQVQKTVNTNPVEVKVELPEQTRTDLNNAVDIEETTRALKDQSQAEHNIQGVAKEVAESIKDQENAEKELVALENERLEILNKIKSIEKNNKRINIAAAEDKILKEIEKLDIQKRNIQHKIEDFKDGYFNEKNDIGGAFGVSIDNKSNRFYTYDQRNKKVEMLYGKTDFENGLGYSKGNENKYSIYDLETGVKLASKSFSSVQEANEYYVNTLKSTIESYRNKDNYKKIVDEFNNVKISSKSDMAVQSLEYEIDKIDSKIKTLGNQLDVPSTKKGSFYTLGIDKTYRETDGYVNKDYGFGVNKDEGGKYILTDLNTGLAVTYGSSKNDVIKKFLSGEIQDKFSKNEATERYSILESLLTEFKETGKFNDEKFNEATNTNLTKLENELKSEINKENQDRNRIEELERLIEEEYKWKDKNSEAAVLKNRLANIDSQIEAKRQELRAIYESMVNAKGVSSVKDVKPEEIKQTGQEIIEQVQETVNENPIEVKFEVDKNQQGIDNLKQAIEDSLKDANIFEGKQENINEKKYSIEDLDKVNEEYNNQLKLVEKLSSTINRVSEIEKEIRNLEYKNSSKKELLNDALDGEILGYGMYPSKDKLEYVIAYYEAIKNLSEKIGSYISKNKKIDWDKHLSSGLDIELKDTSIKKIGDLEKIQSSMGDDIFSSSNFNKNYDRAKNEINEIIKKLEEDKKRYNALINELNSIFKESGFSFPGGKKYTKKLHEEDGYFDSVKYSLLGEFVDAKKEAQAILQKKQEIEQTTTALGGQAQAEQQVQSATQQTTEAIQEQRDSVFKDVQALSDLKDVKFEGTKENILELCDLLEKFGVNIENILWHKGDLDGDYTSKYGKSDSLGYIFDSTVNNHDPQSFGALGTGTYALSNVAGNKRSLVKGQYWHMIDSSVYNMLNTQESNIAERLYEFLEYVNKICIAATNYRGFDFDLKDKDLNSIFKEYNDVCNKIGLDFKTFSEFITEQRKYASSLEVKEYSKSPRKFDFKDDEGLEYQDSFSTKLMKQLGWQGVNNYGTSLDGYYHGSVIYDVDELNKYIIKFEDLNTAVSVYTELMRRAGLETSNVFNDENAKKLWKEKESNLRLERDYFSHSKYIGETGYNNKNVLDGVFDAEYKEIPEIKGGKSEDNPPVGEIELEASLKLKDGEVDRIKGLIEKGVNPIAVTLGSEIKGIDNLKSTIEAKINPIDINLNKTIEVPESYKNLIRELNKLKEIDPNNIATISEALTSLKGKSVSFKISGIEELDSVAKNINNIEEFAKALEKVASATDRIKGLKTELSAASELQKVTVSDLKVKGQENKNTDDEALRRQRIEHEAIVQKLKQETELEASSEKISQEKLKTKQQQLKVEKEIAALKGLENKNKTNSAIDSEKVEREKLKTEQQRLKLQKELLSLKDKEDSEKASKSREDIKALDYEYRHHEIVKSRDKDIDLGNFNGDKTTTYTTVEEDANGLKLVESEAVSAKEAIEALDEKIIQLIADLKSGNLDKSERILAEDELKRYLDQLGNISKNSKIFKSVKDGGLLGRLTNGFEIDNNSKKNIEEELSKYISSAYDGVKKVQSVSFDEINKTFVASFKNTEGIIVSVKGAIDGATSSVLSYAKAEKEATAYLQQWKEGLGKKITSLTQYFTGMSLVMRVFNEFKKGFQFIKDFDTQLTTINQTMSVTATELDEIGRSSISLGERLGKDAKSVLQAVQIYANANETAESILKKATPTIMLSNASGTDTSTASEQLQAVINQFKEYEGRESEVVNIYEKLSAGLPIDFAKGIQIMADATETAGSVASQAG